MGVRPLPDQRSRSHSKSAMARSSRSNNGEETKSATNGGLYPIQAQLATPISNNNGHRHNIWANGGYAYGSSVSSTNGEPPRARAPPGRYNAPVNGTEAPVPNSRAEILSQNGSMSYPAPPSAWSRRGSAFGLIETQDSPTVGNGRASNNGRPLAATPLVYNPDQFHPHVNGQGHSVQSMPRGSSETNLARLQNIAGQLGSSNNPNDFSELINEIENRNSSTHKGTLWADGSSQPSPVDEWSKMASEQYGQSSCSTSHRGSLPPSRAGRNDMTPDLPPFPRQGRSNGLPYNLSFSSVNGDVSGPRGKAQALPGLELYQSGLTQNFDVQRVPSSDSQDHSLERHSSNVSVSASLPSRNAPSSRAGSVPLLNFTDGHLGFQVRNGFRTSQPPTPDDSTPMPFESQYNLLGNPGSTARAQSKTPRQVIRSNQNSTRSSPPAQSEPSGYTSRPFTYGTDASDPDLQELNERFTRMYPSQGPNQYMDPHIQQFLAVQARYQYPGTWNHGIQSGMQSGMPMNELSQYTPMQQVPQPLMQTMSAVGDLREAEADPRGVRSTKLQEFKSSQGKYCRQWELKDIYGHIVEFCGDQQGSRFVQNKLTEGVNSDEKKRIFAEIEPNALQLMMDVFGNYVMQKLFDHGDQSQKRMLADKMKGNVHKLSIQVYGCRSVQKAFEHVLVDQQASLVAELKGKVLSCVEDQHGNHCIQMAIAHIPIEHISFISDAFISRVEKYAMHSFGCRVIQRLLEKCKGAAKARILQELHEVGARLITDQFGNYVAQHMIRHGTDEDRARLFEHISAHLTPFCRQKFASNVVEASIEKGTDEQKRIIMLRMCQRNEKGLSSLPLLIGDSYANYVLQKLLLHLSAPDLCTFTEILRPEVLKAKRLTPTKHVEHLYSKLMSEPTKVGAQEVN